MTEKKRQKRHQTEKYVKPQQTSHTGQHSSEERRHSDVHFPFRSPMYTALGLTLEVKAQSLRDQ